MTNMLSKCRAYAQLMRWHRPIGTLLLLWPTLWALWIAGQGQPAGSLVLIFTLGVFLTRSAGCVINDLADRHWDGAVSRTRNRPLVTGQVSPKEALILVLTLSLLAAGLLWPLNALARLLAIPAIVLMVTYPFMKRVTHLPQFVLGIAFSWGIPMAFAAQTGEVPLLGWLLFLLTCLWTIAYDTMYAMADRTDDLQVGIKSTAILWGNWETSVIALLHALMLLLLWVLGQQWQLGRAFFLGLIVAAGIMVYLQCLIWNRRPEACLIAFQRSQWIGCVIFLGLVLGL